MRFLKLVIWDLDETLLTGVLAEGDEAINPIANQVRQQLDEQGVLQALATQNPADIIPTARQKFDWLDRFVQIEADLGPKARKVRRILENLEINPLDVAFVDEDPFERDSISAQIAGITAWSIAGLQTYLANGDTAGVTAEARRRPQMYREQQQRLQETEAADNYLDFLRACHLQITIRPYQPEDVDRAAELLTRTHRMNLGILPVEEAIARLNQPAEHFAFVAEMKDVYGDMGRCGLMQLTPAQNGEALIESLAISCRTRARGLSLAMFAGLLGHPDLKFDAYRCRYRYNGSNRPLRMLLLSTGFKPQKGTDDLCLTTGRLRAVELPDWVAINYQPVYNEVITYA